MPKQWLGLAGIGTAGMDGRPHFAVEVLLDFEFPAETKSLVLQEEPLVELGDQPLQIFQLDRLAELLQELRLNFGQSPIAVHQRGQHGGGVWNHDRAGKTFRIAQCEVDFAIGAIDGKAFDGAQPRP